MIAYSESLFGPTNLFPKPISNPHFFGSILCFNLGFGKKQGLEQSKKLWLLDHKVEKKMELIRKLIRGCFMDRRRMGLKVEVESVNGGKDVFDAVSADAKIQPEHLVIMVNGIVGSVCRKWRREGVSKMERHEDLPIPIYETLEPVYGVESQIQEALLRFENLKSKFIQVFGHSPQIFARSPGRVNLIGEHIDYEGYSVLPMAIRQNTIVAIRKRDAVSHPGHGGREIGDGGDVSVWRR